MLCFIYRSARSEIISLIEWVDFMDARESEQLIIFSDRIMPKDPPASIRSLFSIYLKMK